MRQDHWRPGKKALREMSPNAVAMEARFMLEQLSLPVDPRDTIKARRERAIARSGLSHAKGFRVWYAQTCALLAHEYLALCDAYKKHVEKQEKLLADELEELRALRAARQIRESQLVLPIKTHQGAVATSQDVASDTDRTPP